MEKFPVVIPGMIIQVHTPTAPYRFVFFLVMEVFKPSAEALPTRFFGYALDVFEDEAPRLDDYFSVPRNRVTAVYHKNTDDPWEWAEGINQLRNGKLQKP